MINQMRADFYRQSHSWGVWVIAGLAGLYAWFSIHAQSVGGITVNPPQKLLVALAQKHWSVKDGLHASVINSSVLLYLFIGLLVIVVGYEFSQHTYKNTLISSISRLQFILAKYLTLVIDLLIGFIGYEVVVLLTGSLSGWQLGATWPQLIGQALVIALASTFFVSVIFSLAIGVLVDSGSVVIATVFAVLWPLSMALLQSLSGWHWLQYIDFFGAVAKIAVGQIAISLLGRYIAVSLVILIVTIGMSAIVMRQKEL